jgi:hypothetical protein
MPVRSEQVAVGTFTVPGSTVVAFDTEDRRSRVEISNVRAGTWVASVGRTTIVGGAPRVSEVVITRNGSNPSCWEFVGQLAVASETVALVGAGSEAEALGRQAPPGEASVRATPHGIVTPSGMGAGLYPVFVAKRRGEVIGVRIVFISRAEVSGHPWPLKVRGTGGSRWGRWAGAAGGACRASQSFASRPASVQVPT